MRQGAAVIRDVSRTLPRRYRRPRKRVRPRQSTRCLGGLRWPTTGHSKGARSVPYLEPAQRGGSQRPSGKFRIRSSASSRNRVPILSNRSLKSRLIANAAAVKSAASPTNRRRTNSPTNQAIRSLRHRHGQKRHRHDAKEARVTPPAPSRNRPPGRGATVRGRCPNSRVRVSWGATSCRQNSCLTTPTSHVAVRTDGSTRPRAQLGGRRTNRSCLTRLNAYVGAAAGGPGPRRPQRRARATQAQAPG